MAGLYLHIPFCRRKCPYCDFFSCADREALLPDYHRLLIRQLQLATAEGWQGPFSTIYFGGGTPSLLTPAQIGALLEEVASGPGLTPEAEISLEVNPGAISAADFAEFNACGVNRLSFGVQSLDDARLRQLQRLHDGARVRQALEEATRSGFSDISCDLMFALPDQTLPELASDLERLLELPTSHISIYGLSLEPETPWGQEPRLFLPDEDCYAAMYQLIHQRLEEAGYEHYEISNFARPGARCRHNLGYWQRQSCLALGAGAHGFDSRGWGERWLTPPDLNAFVETLARGESPMVSLEKFDRQSAMAETAYLALRTARGLSTQAFYARFEVDFGDAFASALDRLGNRIYLEHGYWHLGVDEWLIYDHLISHFL